MTLTRVKICCIANKKEANLAIEYGASAVGLVSEMPSGPGVISDELIKEIAGSVPPPIATFLLTSKTSANEIIAHQKKVNTNTIQIVDSLMDGKYEDIRLAIPAVKIVQVIHVLDESSIDEAIEISESVDALLLDSGNPNLSTKKLGGTGKTHNWKLSRKIVEQSKIPVFLAGGLSPENIQKAIDEVQPFGVDICSGVRSNNALDESKLEAFFRLIEM